MSKPDVLPVFHADPPSKQPVRVYVRKGAHDNERRLSFSRPEGLSVRECLNKGIAIDGNQVAFAIYGKAAVDVAREVAMSPGGQHLGPIEYSGPFVNRNTASSLFEALAQAELGLVELLATYGYDAQFE